MSSLAPLPDFLHAPATAKVLGALPGSRAVGGAVRDAMAGLPVADVDVAAPSRLKKSWRVCWLLAARFLKRALRMAR